MADQQTVETIKGYAKKLRRVITQEADLNLIKYRLVKKSKIDDIFCCLIASLPEIYKKALNDTRQTKLSSKIAYDFLASHARKKFFLSSDLYIIETTPVLKNISIFEQTIAKDIDWTESHEF